MTKKDFFLLIDKYLAGKTGLEDEELLAKFYMKYRKGEEEEILSHLSATEEEILTAIHNRIEKRPPFNWQIWIAAAAILILLGTVAVIHMYKDRALQYTNDSISKGEQVQPGGNKAILRLANGKQIMLDERQDTLSLEGGIEILKTVDGQLVYNINLKHAKDEELSGINTIETPSGGQYQVRLPDGTKVWLNAASSLSYGLDFRKERRVRLQGEAYFEVAKKNIPFVVRSDAQEVHVLGTHFNVTSYSDEALTTTTLVEGKVNVRSLKDPNEKQFTLSPLTKAVTNTMTGNTIRSKADVESTLAWKKGDFQFIDVPLADIMRTIARWYVVEVDYASLPKTRYTLLISKTVVLADVLDMLGKTGPVQFYLNNKTIQATKLNN